MTPSESDTDKFPGIPLSDSVSRTVRAWVEDITGKAIEPKVFPLSLYFLAGAADQQEAILNTLRDQLNQKGLQQKIFTAKITKPDQYTVVREIDHIKEQVGKGKNPVAIILIEGFEDIVSREDNIFGNSIGHLLYQRLDSYDNLKRYFGKKNKHVVVITKIVKGGDKSVYNKALTSGLICQFKDGILEYRV